MLRAILNKSWRQHPTRQQLYGHLPPITKTIQVRRTRHAGHCWRNISDVLLWTPTYGQAKAGLPARTYIQQLCEDMGYSPEDLPEAMNDREKWQGYPCYHHDMIFHFVYRLAWLLSLDKGENFFSILIKISLNKKTLARHQNLNIFYGGEVPHTV